MEKRQADITEEPERAESYQAGSSASGLNREFSNNAADLAELTPQWEAAATKLAEWDAD